MNFKNARFETSAPTLATCPGNSVAEVAFAGRSNAGKSSAINAITENTRLARTSKTPGRTQLMNFFAVEEDRYLVDLPGYGYAKVALSVRDKWQLELEQYLRRREALFGLILLSDIRHPLKEFDQMMIDWSLQAELPIHVLLTKSDKLKRGAAQNALLSARALLQKNAGASVQLFSSVSGIGIDEAREKLENWLKTGTPIAEHTAGAE